MSTRPRVGVRELRQNLSVYLRRVLEGETLEVTERGNAVALLTPLPERSDALERLISEGRVARPETRDLAALGPPLRITDADISGALDEQRAKNASSWPTKSFTSTRRPL